MPGLLDDLDPGLAPAPAPTPAPSPAPHGGLLDDLDPGVPAPQHAPFLQELGSEAQKVWLGAGQMLSAPFALAEAGGRALLGAQNPTPGSNTPLAAYQEYGQRIADLNAAQQSYEPRTGLAALPKQAVGLSQWAMPEIGLPLAAGELAQGATQEAKARGDSDLSAAFQGLTSGAVAVAAPQIVSEAARLPFVAPILSEAGGAVTKALLGRGVGEAPVGMVTRTAGSVLHGAGTGLTLTLGSAGTNAAAGHTDEALQELEMAPENMVAMAFLSAVPHLAGETVDAIRRPAPQAVADAKLLAQRTAAEAAAPELQTPEQKAADIAALHTREGYATPPVPNEATLPPAELAANEAALQTEMRARQAQEQEATLNREIVGQQAEQAAAEQQAKEAAAEPARAAMASGEGLESHLPPAPETPTEAAQSEAIFKASEQIRAEHDTAQKVIDALSAKESIGGLPRDVLEERLNAATHRRHEEAISAIQAGKPIPTEPHLAEEMQRSPEAPREETPLPEPKAPTTEPQIKAPTHDREIRQQIPGEGQGRQNDLGRSPNAREGISAAPSDRNKQAPPRAGRNAAKEVTTKEPLELQVQRKKVSRIQEQLQRAKLSTPEQTRLTQAHAAESAKLAEMETAHAPKAEAPVAEAMSEATARRQLTAALTGTKVRAEHRQAVVDTTIAHLAALGKPQGKSADQMLAEHVHSVRRGKLPKGKTGGVEFLEDGKAIIHVAESADETTIGHELLHIFRRRLPEADLQTIEKHYGIQRSDWGTAKGRQAEEKFVADAEREQQTGTPPAGLVGIFTRFKEWAASVGRAALGSNVKSTPAFKAVIDRMYTKGLGKYQKVGDETPIVETPKPAKALPETKPAVATGKEGEPVTGIKNDITDADRARLGLPPRETPEGRELTRMFAEGQAAVAADSNALPALLVKLEKEPGYVPTDTEVGMLVKHKVDLENGLHELLARADKAKAEGDANGELIARAQLEGHRTAMRKFIELEEQSGTAAGRALVARQMMSGMDYSLSHMEAEAEAAKGSKLTDAELKKVRLLYQDVQNTMTAAEKYRDRLKQRLEGVQAKIEAGATPREKAKAAPADAETLRLQTQLEVAKRRWNAEVRRLEDEQRTLGQKALGAVKAVPGFAKSLKASLDDSAVFRQGWRVMFTHPEVWFKNALRTFEDAWKTFGGEHVMDAVRAELKLNPYYDQARQAGLAIGHAEEDFPTSLPERVPVLGKAYKAAENAFTAFQYRNRMQVFEKYMDIAKASGVDVTEPSQLRSIGKLVNSLTARASLGKLEPIGGVANNVFFSARKLKADFDFLTLHAGSKDFSSFARKQAVINLAKVVAGTASILLIANAVAPGSVESDPRSANFGKIKAGNTRFDVTGGMAPILTLAARLATMSTKSSVTGEVRPLNELAKSGKPKFGAPTATDVVGDFTRNKLSPVASVIWNRMRGQRFGGEKPTLASDAEDLLLPLAISNFLELQNDTGATPELTAAGVLADFFGVSVNTYSGKQSKPKP